MKPLQPRVYQMPAAQGRMGWKRLGFSVILGFLVKGLLTSTLMAMAWFKFMP